MDYSTPTYNSLGEPFTIAATSVVGIAKAIASAGAAANWFGLKWDEESKINEWHNMFVERNRFKISNNKGLKDLSTLTYPEAVEMVGVVKAYIAERQKVIDDLPWYKKNRGAERMPNRDIIVAKGVLKTLNDAIQRAKGSANGEFDRFSVQELLDVLSTNLTPEVRQKVTSALDAKGYLPSGKSKKQAALEQLASGDSNNNKPKALQASLGKPGKITFIALGVIGVGLGGYFGYQMLTKK